MKKNIFLIISLLVISSIFLSGCSEESKNLTGEEKRFIATWSGGGQFNDVLSFFEDGTCSFKLDLSGVWKIKDNKLTITTNTDEYVYDYEFSENNDLLILTPEGGDIPLTYRKQ